MFGTGRGHDKGIVLDTPTIVRLLREKLLDFEELTRNGRPRLVLRDGPAQLHL